MNDLTEVWKLIPSQPDLEASSLGRVRVMPHKAVTGLGLTRTYGGVPTCGQWDGKRFIYARKHHNTLRVARLVCEAFHGPAPEGLNCLHIDESSANNSPDNLKWGTQKENLNCPKFLAYCKSRTGEKNPYTKGRHVS
jgi:hypothetical protein